jgi:hypothetical protein
MLSRLITAALFCSFGLEAAFAAPSRVIILRHGEKEDAWQLCGIGQERAAALAANYLGRDSADSLFAAGEGPAAFLAVTLHTLELAQPAATTWSLPITLYSVLPQKDEDKDQALNRATQQAASDLMSNPAWQGKTVVMAWEHKHIANAKLERAFSDEKVTLRQLLKLDKLTNVPDWPSGNYDYFWIVDFAKDSAMPTGFRMVKQEFSGTYANLPSNDWGEPNGLTAKSKCDLKGAE